MKKSNVTVFALGGTIAITESPIGGVVPTLPGDMLVKAVPPLAELANIETESFRRVLAHTCSSVAIEQAVAKGVRGIVVTQDTDTIEETGCCALSVLDCDTRSTAILILIDATLQSGKLSLASPGEGCALSPSDFTRLRSLGGSGRACHAGEREHTQVVTHPIPPSAEVLGDKGYVKKRTQ